MTRPMLETFAIVRVLPGLSARALVPAVVIRPMKFAPGENMRYLFAVLSLSCCMATSALAQVSVGIGLPGVSIGINLPIYPQLVQVPGYPVYYAPQVSSNFFFYDGMYWVYQGNNWYASTWYNGPWGLVGPQYVPLYVLRVPVRYYRAPPPYFRGWRNDAPPRWGEHWGNEWERDHHGWDQWNRHAVPAPAPLPAYQRRYSAERYPGAEQQQALRNQNYRYQPHEPVVKQHYESAPLQRAPSSGPQGRDGSGQPPGSRSQDPSRAKAPPPSPQAAQAIPHTGPPQATGKDRDRSAPPQAAPEHKAAPAAEPNRPHQTGEAPREPPAPNSGHGAGAQGKGGPQGPKDGQGQGQQKGRD